jgi:hypothetical protein
VSKYKRIQVVFNLDNDTHRMVYEEILRSTKDGPLSKSEYVREHLVSMHQFKPYNAESSRRLIEQRLESRPTFRR